MKLENNLEMLKEAKKVIQGNTEEKIVVLEKINNLEMDYSELDGYVYGQLKELHTCIYTSPDKLYDETKINELADSGLTGSKRTELFKAINGNITANAIVIIDELIRQANVEEILKPYFQVGGKR